MCMKTLLVCAGVFLFAFAYYGLGNHRNEDTLSKSKLKHPESPAIFSWELMKCMSGDNPKFSHKLPEGKSYSFFDYEALNNNRLSESEILSFSIKEKVSFSIYYPESYGQICSIYSEEKDYPVYFIIV